MAKLLKSIIVLFGILLAADAQADNPIRIKIPTFRPNKPVIVLYHEFLQEGRFCRVNGVGRSYAIGGYRGYPSGKARIYGKKMASYYPTTSCAGCYGSIDNRDDVNRGMDSGQFATINNRDRVNSSRRGL